ncbi:putative zinc finger protein family member [Trypanosoma rangeli]|uniref:Putative zinc finger protein family member n=1 Tax=Trypanosoma rangeli TaxID=5698 RepID=A0A422NK16_TRYRA|nr:putative zinc finger protein family member [Trypanosoma rangeli]RNF05840.1 putative zinc finger protein family member [Trypanosoma rangeli]|eukprot:RNF05840.1 putative zinc finger protein family member [Trypanosoma rangeli]
MFVSDPFHQNFTLGTGGNPPGAASPLMMMCGVYPESNGAASAHVNQPSIAANTTAVRQCHYGFPMNGFGAPLPAPQEEEGETEGQYMSVDNHWKAPASVHPAAASASAGWQIFFGAQRPTSGAGNCNSMRSCDAFQESQSIRVGNRNDVHVHPECLATKPQEMLLWLQEKECEFRQTRLQDKEKLFRVFCADLKEVVEVPIYALRFTKGLYVDPSLRARRMRSGHQNQFAMMASQFPTACGLFSEDPSLCKWERWCNQVHIEKGWMHTKKRKFEAWSNALERRFNGFPPDYLFPVHDPQLKSTLCLPKACIAGFSRGLFQGSAKKVPSVCMLFQRGRCTANSCCNQIHVDPAYLQLHRCWVCNSDKLTEKKRIELWEQMESLLASLSSRCKRDAIDKNDLSDSARKLNPNTQPFVLSPPPSKATEEMTVETSTIKRVRINPDACTRKGDGSGTESLDFCQPSRAVMSGPVLMEEPALYFPPVRSPDTPVIARPHQQKQDSLHTHISTNGTSSSNSRLRTTTAAGKILPLGEFFPIVDGDERSQSSLQASHSNISHASRSHRHTNNPYTLGGSSSCAALPSFGWVQPVRSAGNSVTTISTSYIGADASGSTVNVGCGMRTKADPSPGASVIVSALFPAYHDPDRSLHASAPNQPWNGSGSVGAKTME